MSAALRIPQVIGHRGAAASAPENTLAGFRRARALGCRWVEFDVRLAADGGLAVIHDATLWRTTHVEGRVKDFTLAQLAAFDAGDGAGVPALAQVFDLLAGLGLGANVEIKAENDTEAEVTGGLAAVACAQARHRLGLDLLISSFSSAALAASRGAAPDVPRALLRGAPGRDWRALASALGCVGLHVAAGHANRALAAAVHGAGMIFMAYTVNDPAQARALVAQGVDGLFSDRPDVILAALAERQG